MTGKELLKQHDSLNKEITELENRIKKVQAYTCKIEFDSVKGSNPNFPYELKNFNIEGYNYPAADRKELRLNKLNHLLSKRKETCEDMKLQIEEFINTIPDSKTRRVFQYRYIDNLGWQAIAMRLGKCHESYPRRDIHDKYLENL